MPDIITRAGKGSPLTNDEADANFVNLEAPTMEVWEMKVASFNVEAKGRYFCEGVGIVATLPAAPPDETEVWFSGSFAVNHLTVSRSGASIAGIAQDLILDQDHLMPKLIYHAGNWRVSQ